jgi:hypothetical protein
MTFEAALAELEAVTTCMRHSDPSDFARITQLLDGRQQVMTQMTLGLATHAPTPETATRLQQVFDQGAQFEEILSVTRAAVRHQLAELYRANFHARAMSVLAAPPPDLDIQA